MIVVLIVEDEDSYRYALSYLLRREGFEVLVAADGTEGLALFDRHGADIVLLDLMMPGLTGTEVCRRIRQRSSVPIIMVTARDDEIDKVVALELGADDYVTKPFGHRELVARIRAVLRRGTDAELLPDLIEASGVRMDVERHEVWVDGQPVRLALKDSTLRCCCATAAGCLRGASSSTASGAPTTWATPRPWTSTSSVCARRSSVTRGTPSG